MEIRVRLAGTSEAERLKTALYRFQEVRNFAAGPAPQIRLTRDAAGLVSVVDLGSADAAEEFHRFWTQFRAEPFALRGLHDF